MKERFLDRYSRYRRILYTQLSVICNSKPKPHAKVTTRLTSHSYLHSDSLTGYVQYYKDKSDFEDVILYSFLILTTIFFFRSGLSVAYVAPVG